MLSHIGIYVNDIERARSFYTTALKPLGYEQLMEFPEWSVIGLGANKVPDVWISQREASHNVHMAIAATDIASVDAFHAAALAAGGTDNGAPGYRKEYTPGYYAAFITDPFGNNVEAVFMDPTPIA